MQVINSYVLLHVKTVVLLSQLKQKPDGYINVTIELDNVDITSAETRATYDEIKKAELRLERIIIYLKMKIAGSRSVQKIKRAQLWRH